MMYEKLKSLRKSAKSGTTNLINYLLIFNHRQHTNFQIWTENVYACDRRTCYRIGKFRFNFSPKRVFLDLGAT